MNKQDLSKLQTCVLRVNIHCDGCKKKVKKLLQKIDGVYSTKIDAETGKVSVTGNVDPTTLVKKLVKSGKHAEIWSFQKGSSGLQGNLNSQFKNMVQIENLKGGRNNNHHGAHNNGGKEQQQQKLGNFYKDPMAMGMAMAAPSKDKKYVKNNLPEVEFDVSDDEFDDEDEFDDDQYDDEFDDDGGGGGDHGLNHGNHGANKTMAIPMMGKGHGPHAPHGMVNVHAINKGGVGSNKKGGFIDIPSVLKGKNDKAHPENGSIGSKKGCSGEKNGRGEGFGGGKTKGSEEKKGGKSKKHGKGGGGLLSFGKKSGALFGFGKKKKSIKGGESDSKKGKAKGSTNNNGRSIKGGGNHESGPKKGGGRKDSLREFCPLEEGFHEINISKPMKGGSNGGGGSLGGGNSSVSNEVKMGPIAPIGPRGFVNGHPNQFEPMSHVNGLPGQMFPGQMFPMGHGNPHMGQMGGNLGQMGNYPMANIPAVQGLPAQARMNGGYYQGVGPANPYNQQYMAMMMMNQQRGMMGNGMQQPMMFGGPFSAINHASMPPISPARDSYVHYFSDENANSCSIM